MRIWLSGIILLFVLAGCGLSGEDEGAVSAEIAPTTVNQVQPAAAAEGGMGMGMGQMSDAMRTAHHATIPDAYAAATHPDPADAAALERGAVIYTTYCAVCHGDGGMGDGPGGVALNPPASPIAQTSQMLGDNYLFWRVNEGGQGDPVTSAMPSWKDTLSTAEMWDVLHYVRALGQGSVTPRVGLGGSAYDPAVAQQNHADMLAEATGSGVISADEAKLFDAVHAAMDALMAGEQPRVEGNMDDNMDAMLEMLISAGAITGEQSDAFQEIHARLLDAGLMR